MQNPQAADVQECAPVRETFVDFLVAKAKADGAFDNLPGAGKPIADLEEPYDELWWAKKLIEREELKKLFRERQTLGVQASACPVQAEACTPNRITPND